MLYPKIRNYKISKLYIFVETIKSSKIKYKNVIKRRNINCSQGEGVVLKFQKEVPKMNPYTTQKKWTIDKDSKKIYINIKIVIVYPLLR